jgi:hypothetical protein
MATRSLHAPPLRSVEPVHRVELDDGVDQDIAGDSPVRADAEGDFEVPITQFIDLGPQAVGEPGLSTSSSASMAWKSSSMSALAAATSRWPTA